jgi:hypothetical protein
MSESKEAINIILLTLVVMLVATIILLNYFVFL